MSTEVTTPPASAPAASNRVPPQAPGSPSDSHREAHLMGKPITVVYEITDPTAWRKTNPLNYEHDGVKAYCVCIGDLAARRDELRAALEKIVDICGGEARAIAADGLDADDRSG